MNKICRFLLSRSLVLVLMLSLILPVQLVRAATDESYFTFNDRLGAITGYSASGPKDVVIPETIDGMAVTRIGFRTFSNLGITTLIIPESVTVIDTQAFISNNLTSVLIPSSVTSIGASAFYSNNLTTITIPESVTSIGANLFEDNSVSPVTIIGCEDSAAHTYAKAYTLQVGNNPALLFVSDPESCNQPPTDISLSSSAVDENLPAGTTVGTLSAVDVDLGETFTYQLASGTGDTDNTSFTIDGTILKTAAVFNFEQQASYSIRVRVTDSKDHTYEKQMTITVNDVNDAPTAADVLLSTNGDTAGNGQLQANDEDGDALTYAISQQGSKGTLTITDVQQGTFTYVPLAGETGNDTVTYYVHDGELESNPATVHIQIVPSDVAELANLVVYGPTAEVMLQPAFSAEQTDYIAVVPNSVSHITFEPTAAEANATIRVGVDGEIVSSGERSAQLELTVGVNAFEITVTAQDQQTVNTYTVTITREALSIPSAPPISPPVASVAPATRTEVDVLVNGKVERAGTATIGEVNGQEVTTVVVDEEIVQQRLVEDGERTVVTIPVNTGSEVVIGALNGRMVKSMEQKQAVVEIRTAQASYTLPAQVINIDAISEHFGTDLALQDIQVQIEIAKPQASVLQLVEDAANEGGFSLVVPPLDFKVTAVYDGQFIEVTRFNAYVERSIALPEGSDPSTITTAIVVEPDGTVRHMPTKVVQIDNRYYAQINSLTNSTYTVIWNPLKFQDVEGHWAKAAINNMGARMVMNGMGEGVFEPNEDMTRAEFADMIVRGLGLRLETGAVPFTDVPEAASYHDVVYTAYTNHLINGFEDGSFRPDEQITREQAMVLLAKAMEMTELATRLPMEAAEEILKPYRDAADTSSWAENSVAATLQAGIVLGRREDQLALKAYVTRAEAALMMQRLLQASDLI